MSVSQQNQIVFILGAPFSGRSTQCQRYAQEFNFNYISVSDLMKNIMNTGTNKGNLIKSYMDKNELVPTELTIDIIQEQIKDLNCKKVLLDGFPKDLDQALQFEKQIGSIESLLYIECDIETLTQRQKQQPQIQENFEQRLELYFKKTKPVLQYYRTLNKVYKINGNNSVYTVQKEIIQVMSPNMIFFLGAPCTGKKTHAKYLADKIDYHYVNFNDLFEKNNCEDENQQVFINYKQVNVLINYLKSSYYKFFIFDSIFLSTKILEIITELFTKPKKVFYLEASKDQIEELIKKNSKDKKEIQKKMNEYQSFINNHKSVLDLLQKQVNKQNIKDYFQTINIENQTISDVQLCIMKLIHPLILLSHEGSNPTLQNEFLERLQDKGYITLHIPTLIVQEKYQDNFENKLKMIRKIIFRQPELYKQFNSCFQQIFKIILLYQNRFIISDFSTNLEDYIRLENRVNFMLTYIGDQPQNLAPQTHYYSQGKLVKISDQFNDTCYLDIFIQKQANYTIILGSPFCGKTTLSKYLKEKYAFNLVDYDKIIQQLKEKLGGDDGPLEEVPFDPFCNYLSQMIKNQKEDEMILFDGWNHGQKELQQLFENAGNPRNIICLIQSKENATKSYRKKKEMDETAELGEDDIKEIENYIQKQKDYKEFFQKAVENNYFTQFNIDGGQEKMLQDSNKIFQKRVLCVDIRNGDYKRYSQIFANVCQKLDIHFIDVQQAIQKAYLESFKIQLTNEYSMRWTYLDQNYPSNYSPKLIIEIIKKQLLKYRNQSRDILLFGYPSADQNLQRNINETYFPRITDEINEILKNFGSIRSLFSIDSKIHNEQDIKYDDPIQEKIVQIVDEKKKIIVDGDEEQIEEKVDEDGEQQQKKWNFEDYSWTQSDGNSKNILKIYSKLFESNEFSNTSIKFQDEDGILKEVQKVIMNLNEGYENGFLIQIEDN